MSVWLAIILILMALDSGFILGCWWASRTKPDEDDNNACSDL